MDPETILSKSAKGKEEIDTRKYKLDQRVRSLLITINGKLTAGQLAAQFASQGDINPVLEQLLRDGFVQQASDPARLDSIKAELAAMINAALGPPGDAIAIKIEGATTLEELRSYLESHRAMLDGALGKTKGPAFWAKAAAVTG